MAAPLTVVANGRGVWLLARLLSLPVEMVDAIPTTATDTPADHLPKEEPDAA